MLAPFSAAVEPMPTQTSGVPTKQHRFRSLAGCLTCRRRKKKCNEEKPTCVGCARNSLQCVWPTTYSRRKSQKSISRAASQDRKACSDHLDPSAQWSILTGSFVSPTRASALTEISSLLFTHYTTETANVLSTFPPDSNNPLVTLLVPLCCNDDLLMNSLLAISGAHLKCTNSGIEVYLATYRHYSIVIRTIRDCISNQTTLDVPQALRMLLALVMLSFFETLSGDDQGAMFNHLRASRQIILRLADSPLPSSTNDNGRLFAFILEIYRYLILSNNIIPYGSINCRIVPQDTFLDDILGKMSHFDTWGFVLGDSHGLFGILPSIAVLAARRLTEQNASQASSEMFQELHVQISGWKPPESTLPDQKLQFQREMALNLCREATFLYLETAMAADASSETQTLAKIQKYLDNIIFYAEQAAGSPYETIFLGPLLIAGSCMLRQDQRQLLQAGLRSNRFHMNHCLQAASLLEHLWNDPSGRVFGPYGLAIIMRRNKMNLGVA